ncbi:His Phos 2 domain containing protein, partial [Asbolus verrucosus]
RGIQNQYDLGLWLRDRYSDFLPSRYSPRTIRAVSTDVDRTLMSAEATLAGLFQPTESEKWNKNINWQPVPIHTAPPEDDPLLAMKKFCKKYNRLFNELLTSKHIREINEINKNLFDFLSENSGESVRDVYDVEFIYNTLLTQNLSNKTLPEWAMEVYPDKMKPSVILRFKLPCYNQELARLKTGLLFGEIVKNFKEFAENSIRKASKLLMFSGHDSTLADVLTTMGAFNDEIPSYSSAIIIELYRNETDLNPYVNVFFRNNTGIHNITLENCDFDCDFGNFVQIFEPIIQSNLTQWEEECEN